MKRIPLALLIISAALAFSLQLWKKAESTEILLTEEKTTLMSEKMQKLKFWQKDESEIPIKKTFPCEVPASSVQFKLDDYKDYFVKPSIIEVNLKSRNYYLISCSEDIIGINWGDSDNINV